MSPTNRIIEALKERDCDPHASGNGWSAKCPAHDDERASLSIAEADNGGCVLCCHAGCASETIVAALGMTMADLMPTNGKHSTRGTIAATYDYHDEAGDLLFQVVRFEPKDFRQRKPNGAGGWDWSVKGTRRVPYRLPALHADPTAVVYVVEGEKDADNLAQRGLVATCNAGGAGKWTAEHAKHLAGRQVIILPDNDEPGRKHAEQVARSLAGVASSVKVVEPPRLPAKGDVSDWLANAGTREALERLAGEAAEWTSTANGDARRGLLYRPVVTRLADVQPEAVHWLWPGRIALGKITIVIGDPGLGKSFLSLDLASRVSQGSPWPDNRLDCAPLGSVVVLNAEDGLSDTVRPRLDAMGADVSRIVAIEAVQGEDRLPVNLQRDLPAVELAIEQLADCQLVVIDPISAYLGKVDSHNNADIRALLHPLSELADRHKVAIVCVTHLNKGQGSALYRATGSLAFVAAARAVWLAAKDPEQADRRLFLPVKNNLASDTWGMAFSIVDGAVRWEPEPIQVDANQVLAFAPSAKREADSVAEQLVQCLANGPVDAADVMEWAKANGISQKRLLKAKQTLGVASRKTGFDGGWQWALSLQDCQESLPAKKGILEIFGDSSTSPAWNDCIEPPSACSA